MFTPRWSITGWWGQPVEWVGEITAYYNDMTEAGIWPIIQVEDVPAEELERTVTAAADAGAERLLVYNYSAIKPEHWDPLRRFSPAVNIIAYSAFDLEIDRQGTDKKKFGRTGSTGLDGRRRRCNS